MTYFPRYPQVVYFKTTLQKRKGKERKHVQIKYKFPKTSEINITTIKNSKIKP